jgi:hypothetical protein
MNKNSKPVEVLYDHTCPHCGGSFKHPMKPDPILRIYHGDCAMEMTKDLREGK